jgi:hypothetical protein
VTTYFFDRNFGAALPSALRLLGLDIQSHDEHFAQDTSDDEWLRLVGDRHWIVLTQDLAIKQNANEIAALVMHGVACFAFTTYQLNRWDKLGVIVRAWPEMERIIASEPPPYIYRVNRRAQVERVYPPE